jgi:hypothetical protein
MQHCSSQHTPSYGMQRQTLQRIACKAATESPDSASCNSPTCNSASCNSATCNSASCNSVQHATCNSAQHATGMSEQQRRCDGFTDRREPSPCNTPVTACNTPPGSLQRAQKTCNTPSQLATRQPPGCLQHARHSLQHATWRWQRAATQRRPRRPTTARLGTHLLPLCWRDGIVPAALQRATV